MKCPFCGSKKDVEKLPLIGIDDIPYEIYGCNECKQYLYEEAGALKPVNDYTQVISKEVRK